MQYIEDQVFENIDFTIQKAPKATYEGCLFRNCNLSGIDLSGSRFVECSFDNCNLGNAKILKTVFNSVKFDHCKMIGLSFDMADEFLFIIQCDHCNFHLSSFYGRNLSSSAFRHCDFRECDFINTNISSINFVHCDFLLAKFENTNLEKADFSSSYNYTIDPNINKIRKARFSAAGLPGLLRGFDIVID